MTSSDTSAGEGNRDDAELEALRDAVAMSAERAVFPDDRECGGVFVDEDCLIFDEPPFKVRCSLFGHKTDEHPTIDPVTKAEMGTTTWCRRCGKVIEHDLDKRGEKR